jgi:hypothetical protein
MRANQAQIAGIDDTLRALGALAFRFRSRSSTRSSDPAFLAGQRADAEGLNDKGTGTGPSFVPDWEQPFKSEIHGVFLLAGDSHATVDKKLQEIKNIFGVGGPKPSVK